MPVSRVSSRHVRLFLMLTLAVQYHRCSDVSDREVFRRLLEAPSGGYLILYSLSQLREGGDKCGFFSSERKDILTFASQIDCSVYCREAVSLSLHLSQAEAGGGEQIPKLMHSNDSCRSMASCFQPFHKLLLAAHLD